MFDMSERCATLSGCLCGSPALWCVLGSFTWYTAQGGRWPGRCSSLQADRHHHPCAGTSFLTPAPPLPSESLKRKQPRNAAQPRLVPLGGGQRHRGRHKTISLSTPHRQTLLRLPPEHPSQGAATPLPALPSRAAKPKPVSSPALYARERLHYAIQLDTSPPPPVHYSHLASPVLDEIPADGAPIK